MFDTRDAAQPVSTKKHERCQPRIQPSQESGLQEGKDYGVTPHRVRAVQVQTMGNCAPEDQVQVNTR